MPGTASGDADQFDEEDNIWIAASDGRIEDVESYLANGSIDVNAGDAFGYTCVHAAASYGHLELLRLLVHKYGANINITDPDGDSALHVVETADATRLLLELGADPTLRNNDGKLLT
eukprot:jgi/Hompol1/6675/HPOL_000132-RA